MSAQGLRVGGQLVGTRITVGGILMRYAYWNPTVHRECPSGTGLADLITTDPDLTPRKRRAVFRFDDHGIALPPDPLNGQAACADPSVDPAWFDGEYGRRDRAKARQVCAGCPVQDICTYREKEKVTK